MISTIWDRAAIITELRREIWRHLTQAAKSEDDILLHAAALLQMSVADIRTVAQLQFVLSNEVKRLLDGMPALARRLTTTTAGDLEASTERILGPIRWPETFSARAASGLPNLFVTAPTRRVYDTPENQLLVFSLAEVAAAGRRTGWHRSRSPEVGDEIRQRVTTARRWQHIRSLTDVQLQPLSGKTIRRVRAGRNRRPYTPVLDVIALYQRFLARLDREAIKQAVENHALVTSRNSVLLELLCAFRTIEALRNLGWQAPPLGLLRPRHIFHGERDSSSLDLFFQHTPSELSKGSIYRNVQQNHTFAAVGGLVPDLVIRVQNHESTHWVLIEAKGIERSVDNSAREALSDLLAYRRAFNKVLSTTSEPYGIGVAWGQQLEPTRDEITLCTPDTLAAALSLTCCG